jgi:hypothetical protein
MRSSRGGAAFHLWAYFFRQETNGSSSSIETGSKRGLDLTFKRCLSKLSIDFVEGGDKRRECLTCKGLKRAVGSPM